jgi:hypothetical protein
MAEEKSSDHSQSRSASDNVRELTEASKQLFAAGEQLTNNLTELESRVERALDWPSRIGEHALLVGGLGLACSVLLWKVFKG